MRLKFAIMGFRHGHIHDLVNLLKDRSDAVLVAAGEEHAETREQLRTAQLDVPLFDSLTTMLDQVPCDAVGTGDYYGRRGAVEIAALERGKHVISDKPLCTSLRELDTIETLARQRNLCVGCQLNLRDDGLFLAARRLIHAGEIGGVHAVAFNGQHPLLYGTRAGWYFEEGKHGGTINDIAIHAIDAIPWITGQPLARVNAARNWHVRPQQAPHFHDAAQMMLTLANGGGVLGDVSYFAPDSFRYTLPQYWRVTFWGTGGVLEIAFKTGEVILCKDGETEPRRIPPDPGTPGGYLESFLRDIRGDRTGLELDTAAVLRSARNTLRIQEAADRNFTNVKL